MFYDVLWYLERMVRRVGCFFVGHNEVTGERLIYESDWCSKCFCRWPQDRVTLPRLLNRCYGWVVERNWHWFVCLDDWLYINHREKTPDWWEY